MNRQAPLALSLSVTASLFLATAPALAAAKQAPAADRMRPPLPTAIEPFTVPVPERIALSNGLEVRFLERHGAPLVDVVLVVRAGAEDDPADRFGLAAFTADLLNDGAGERGALEFADAIEFLGASLNVGVDFETTALSLHVPSARLAPALDLLADATLRPRFDEAEWQRAKKRRDAAFLQSRDDPGQLSAFARAQALFGEHRYGTPVFGRPTSLARTAAPDLVAFHEAHYRPDNAFLVVVGDVTKEVLVPLLEGRFGAWQAKPGKTWSKRLDAPLAKTRGREIVLVDKPGAAQSVVFAVAAAPASLKPLDAPRETMNTLLGGSFSSRLNQNLREQHQYSYGARSLFDLRPAANTFAAFASVATPVTAPAVAEMHRELVRIRSFIEDDEAARARGYLALSFPSELATNSDLASFWAWAFTAGVDETRVTHYQARVLATKDRELLEAARQSIDLSRLTYVVVGDRAEVETGLAALGLGPVRVVDASALF